MVNVFYRSAAQAASKFKIRLLEDRNLHKLRSLDYSCPFFLSDDRIWGQ